MIYSIKHLPILQANCMFSFVYKTFVTSVLEVGRHFISKSDNRLLTFA